ncbi:MAG: DNA phosphorothioation-associated protein 4 [Cyanobacteriota bacterium]|nr:DNA phosphorothioation-associated protein 4 [Cyanobacteriota bacterium]
MAASRIRITRDKAELVRSLVDSTETTGPFQTYADAIAFAAALGFRHKKRSPLDGSISSEPSPISLDVFVTRGHFPELELLAIATAQNPAILSTFDAEAEAQRITLFEEYANGGLELLRDELRGAVDYAERILLLLTNERLREDKPEGEEFDLNRFLSMNSE